MKSPACSCVAITLPAASTDFSVLHVYEVHPRKDRHGVDLISDVLPLGRLWFDTPDHAIGYATHRSRSHDAVIRLYVRSGKRVRRSDDLIRADIQSHYAVSRKACKKPN